MSRGPVVSEFKVAHPFGKKGSFATTVRLYAGLRRIDIRTRIVNDETFVRYRVLFPTSIRDGQSVHEIPFGAIRRPDGIEFPAQNWIDYGNGQKGVALLNRGLPGNNVADGTMMLSLLRSTRIVSLRLRAAAMSRACRPIRASSWARSLRSTTPWSPTPATGGRRASIATGLEFNHPLLACTAGLAPRHAAQALGVSGDHAATTSSSPR